MSAISDEIVFFKKKKFIITEEENKPDDDRHTCDQQRNVQRQSASKSAHEEELAFCQCRALIKRKNQFTLQRRKQRVYPTLQIRRSRKEQIGGKKRRKSMVFVKYINQSNLVHIVDVLRLAQTLVARWASGPSACGTRCCSRRSCLS